MVDSVRVEGRVVRVGPDPVSWLALTRADGTQQRLLGAGADPLCSVVGARVTVSGAAESDGLRVASFRVTEVDARDRSTTASSRSGARSFR
jgi:hypothetical protein